MDKQFRDREEIIRSTAIGVATSLWNGMLPHFNQNVLMKLGAQGVEEEVLKTAKLFEKFIKGDENGKL